MKEIVVKNQTEFDAVKDQKEDAKILVQDSTEEIYVKSVPQNCYVVAWGSSHVVACDSSHVVARGSSHVVACDSSHVEAWERTTITRRSKNSETKLHGKALLQEASEDLAFPSLKEWLAFWDIQPKAKLRMYKAVKPDLTDFYTGKIHYEVGKTVACPDWLDHWQEECGHGFHVSPQLFLTERYAQSEHVHIAVEVAVKDLRLPKDGRWRWLTRFDAAN